MNHQSGIRSIAIAMLTTILVSIALLPTAAPVAAASGLRLSRGELPPTDSLVIYGAGFSAGDDIVASVNVTVNGQSRDVAATVQTDGNGAFTATLIIPAGTAEGRYTVQARDFHGHAATKDFLVLPLVFL
jgi:hypothetical protein